MANPNPVQSEAFQAQKLEGEYGKSRKTFGIRFSESVESQLLKQSDAYAFIRQAVAEKLSQKPTASDSLAIESCWKLSGQQPIAPALRTDAQRQAIEVRAIVDRQVVYRFKGATGWQYSTMPLAELERAIDRGKAKEVSKP